jgi:hypothetical protein
MRPGAERLPVFPFFYVIFSFSFFLSLALLSLYFPPFHRALLPKGREPPVKREIKRRKGQEKDEKGEKGKVTLRGETIFSFSMLSL